MEEGGTGAEEGREGAPSLVASEGASNASARNQLLSWQRGGQAEEGTDGLTGGWKSEGQGQMDGGARGQERRGPKGYGPWEGHLDGQTKERGRTEGRTDGRMDGRMDGWTDGWRPFGTHRSRGAARSSAAAARPPQPPRRSRPPSRERGGSGAGGRREDGVGQTDKDVQDERRSGGEAGEAVEAKQWTGTFKALNV